MKKPSHTITFNGSDMKKKKKNKRLYSVNLNDIQDHKSLK